MIFLMRSLSAKAITLLILVPVLLLSACGGVASTGGSGGSSGSSSKGNLTVGGKLDTEAQLLTDMYTQLLNKAGFHVTEKLALGNSGFVFNALSSHAIDLYPEFTATGLNKLGITSQHDPQKDYQAVKSGFEQKYQITWLNPAPLNDGYALCTSQAEAQRLGITSISDLAPKVSQLVLASPSDGTDFVDGLKSVYNFTTKSFKSLKTVDEAISFKAVSGGQAQVNVCYTTTGLIASQNFVILKDDKNGFPQFNPAPIVRQDILSKYPDIAKALNPLAPYLTTDVSITLQKQVSDKAKSMSTTEAVKEVAKSFLQSKGLL